MKEEALVLISWISKNSKQVIPWGCLLLLLSCSSQNKKNEDEASLEIIDNLKKIESREKKVNFGPGQAHSNIFKNVTDEYGLENLEAVTINVVDLNRDGFSDLVLLPFYYSRPVFLIFDKKLKKFAPWNHDPLPKDFKASYLLFHDFNKDGVTDLMSGVFNQKSEVTKIPLKFFRGSFKDNKLNFKLISKAIPLGPAPTSSLTIIDYNLDGWTDLFVGNWFENFNGISVPATDKFLVNTTKGGFKESSDVLSGEDEKRPGQIFSAGARPTYGLSTCDIDLNGYPDVLTSSSSGYKNKLWLNLKDQLTGKRYFQDYGLESSYAADQIGSLIITGGGRTFFSACTDYNNDGLMDVFLGELSHGHDNDSVDKSSILTGSKLSFPPYFIRTEYVGDGANESWNQGDRRGIWVDYNLDGRIDLVVDNSGFPPSSRLVLFEQDEHHAFQNVALQSGIDIVNPSATVVLDFNQDGKPDILTAQNSIRRADIKPRLYLFENQIRTKNKILKIHLHGIKSNSDAFGSLVEFTMMSKRSSEIKIHQKRWNETIQGGLPSQNESGVIFGIPSDYLPVDVKVTWPFVKKNTSAMGEVLKVRYNLKDFKIKNYTEITLCENGTILEGKKQCYF